MLPADFALMAGFMLDIKERKGCLAVLRDSVLWQSVPYCVRNGF